MVACIPSRIQVAQLPQEVVLTAARVAQSDGACERVQQDPSRLEPSQFMAAAEWKNRKSKLYSESVRLVTIPRSKSLYPYKAESHS